MLSSSRTPPSTGTSQTSPENKVRLRCMKSARCAEFIRFKTKESEMRMTVILCLIVYSPFFFFFALLFVLPSRFYSINDPHVSTSVPFQSPPPPPSFFSPLFALLSPSCSHQSVEGQGARGVHYKGQPLLPRSLRPGHEGGLPAADRPAEQER